MLKEFKDFAAKGNMLDMAVGIVIGAAFGTVIKSLVNDVIMPVVSAVTGSLSDALAFCASCSLPFMSSTGFKSNPTINNARFRFDS